MERLITGMLQLFTLDSGDEGWQSIALSLVDVILGSLEVREGEITRKQLRLETEWPTTLPPVYGDREKVAILVDALLDNAIKFNRPGGRLSIRVSGPADDGTGVVYLQVHNDGHSVPAEAGDEIFAGYNQLGDIDTQKPAGVGIGLATCRLIAERMAGKIFLEPPGDEGTTFGVLLPVAEGV
jgi:signal transduction histidine kinase